MQATSIGWCDFSANPIKFRDRANKAVWGCVKVSPGCVNCYSENLALRFRRGKVFNAATMETLTPFVDEAELKTLLTSKAITDKRVFIEDMSDLFGEWVADEMLNRIFSNCLERRSDVVFQLLTKRADRMSRYISWRWGEGRIPCRNIHVGVSVEDQSAADERIPLLLQTPAAVRWVSFEPLLEDIGISDTVPPMDEQECCPECGGDVGCNSDGTWKCIHHSGIMLGCGWRGEEADAKTVIDWAVIGGESGPNHRPCEIAWIQSLADQCRAAGVPCYVKQASGLRPGQQGDIPSELWQRKELPCVIQ